MVNVRSAWMEFAALALAAVSTFGAVQGPAAADVSFTTDRLSERIRIVPRDGSLRYGESDIEMNATGLALALRRCYCSSNATEGLFGRGWACLFDRRIKLATNNQQPATVHNEWGEALVFSPRGSSLLYSNSGRSQWLMVEPDRTFLRDHRERFWSFGKDGRLEGIYNVAMVGVDIEYEAERLARVRDAYGRSFRFTTDDDGRVIETRSSAGDLRRYDYEQGRLARVSDANGVRAEYSYDRQGRLSAIIIGGRERAEISYDSRGRVTGLSGPSVAERTVRYQRRTVPFPARVTEIADALGRVTHYRFRDSPPECQVTLPGGAAATISYDERRLPVRMDLPRGRRIALQYDDFGNLKRLTLPGGAFYTFNYAARADLRDWTRADGATFTFARAESGQIREVRGSRRDDVRRLAFDANGRLLALADGPSRAIMFSCNAWGDLSGIEVQNGSTSLLFDHDESGRVSRVAPPHRPAFQVVYGAHGRPEALTDSVGYRLALARDPLGRLSAIEDCEGHRERFERDDGGRLLLWQRPDGSEVRLGYDREGNLEEVHLPEGNICRIAYNERNIATSET
ncbi:hypothetical protein AMJ85_08645, partial [candidate division BRC1 bacterium SM23_51]